MTELEMKIKLNSIIADNSEFTTWTISTPHLMMLVKQVIAEEREACAKVFDDMANQMVADMEPSTAVFWVRSKAAEIRARGENKMSTVSGLDIANNIEREWREAEAHAVPMTPEGVKSAQERWRGFNQGYKQAIKDCVALLMIQHEAAKGSHNYWHVAANLIEAEYGVHHDD